MINRKKTKEEDEKVKEDKKKNLVKGNSRVIGFIYLFVIIAFFFIPLIGFFIYFVGASIKVEKQCNIVFRDGDDVYREILSYVVQSKIDGLFIDEYSHLENFEMHEHPDLPNIEIETRIKYSSEEYFGRIKLLYEIKDGILNINFDKWSWPNWGCPLATMIIKVPKNYHFTSLTVHSQRNYKMTYLNIDNIYFTFPDSRNAHIELDNLKAKSFISKFKSGDIHIRDSVIDNMKINGFVGKIKLDKVTSKMTDLSLDGGNIHLDELKTDFLNVASRKAQILSRHQYTLNSIFKCETCDMDVHVKLSSNIKLSQICKNDKGSIQVKLPNEYSGKFNIQNPFGDNIFRLIILPMKITNRGDNFESGIFGDGNNYQLDIQTTETCQVGVSDEI